MTRQKAAVLAAVKRAKHHPDAKWVYAQVSRQIPDISLGTVYRALASLTAEGLIKEFRQVDGPALYDANTDEHVHLRCRRCGRIENVPPVRLPQDLLEAVREAGRFATVDEVRLEFDGICGRCGEQPGGSQAEVGSPHASER